MPRMMAQLTVYPSDEWLTEINERFRRDHFHPAKRPWLAWDALSRELNQVLDSRHPSVERIFAWFRENTQSGSQSIGPLFNGVFFYDAVFWPLVIWPFFGTVRLEPTRSLDGMPPRLLNELFGAESSRNDFVEVWCASLDFALSFQDLAERGGGRDSLGFLHSARRELIGAASLLLDHRPSAKAGHAAMLAVETIGKWFLSEHGLSMRELIGLSHNVTSIMEKCAERLPGGALANWRDGIAQLPRIAERYRAEEPPAQVLWGYYRTALFVSARLMREKTGRHCIANVQAPKA